MCFLPFPFQLLRKTRIPSFFFLAISFCSRNNFHLTLPPTMIADPTKAKDVLFSTIKTLKKARGKGFRTDIAGKSRRRWIKKKKMRGLIFLSYLGFGSPDRGLQREPILQLFLLPYLTKTVFRGWKETRRVNVQLGNRNLRGWEDGKINKFFLFNH